FGLAQQHDFHLVCFVTPATTPERRAMVVEHAGGFIYYISVRGTTGERSALPADLVSNIRELKSLTPVPVAVGFGISRPDHARAVVQVADGAIVGSAIVRRMWGAAQAGGDPVAAALEFIGPMAKAVKSPR
ncbi:MAG: tryptophan synthase subunit alpha, partial [Candidatus Brocadiaceae bacterium]